LGTVKSVTPKSVPEGDVVVLDTSTVIAYLKGTESVSATAIQFIDNFVATDRNPAVISAATVAEVLVQPYRDQGKVPPDIKTFLLDFPGLTVRSADFLVAAEAARIRAMTGAALPDALVAATATLTSSPWLITNDRTLRDRLSDFDWATQVVLLSDLRLS
jgi:predicted nucleic acid-binding protein